MRAVCVVDDPPGFDDAPGIIQAIVEMFVEALVARATIEAFDEGILGQEYYAPKRRFALMSKITVVKNAPNLSYCGNTIARFCWQSWVMKSFVSLLSLLLFVVIPAVSAQVPIAGQDQYSLNCTESFVDNVNIGTDTLTINTIFTANPIEGGYDWPSIAQTIAYSDGHVLLNRNFGAKLIDDFATCQEWYEVAHKHVVEDFATATIVRDLRSRYSTI